MRHPRWEQRLHTLIVKKRALPHDYGTHDCLIWPGLAVKAVTGEDHVSKHVGKYDSHAKAYRHLKRMGFDSPAALLDSLFDEKPVAFAGRGDLVLVAIPEEIAPGVGDLPAVVWNDALAIVADVEGHEGLARFSRAMWRKAWAVGEHHSGDFQ